MGGVFARYTLTAPSSPGRSPSMRASRNAPSTGRARTFSTASGRRWAAVSGPWADGAACGSPSARRRMGRPRRRGLLPRRRDIVDLADGGDARRPHERPPARDLRPEGRGMAAERGVRHGAPVRSCCACPKARRCRAASSRACGAATRWACPCRSGGNSREKPAPPLARRVLASGMPDRPTDPVRPTDDEARALARSLIADARSGALGVTIPETAHRWSRVSPWCRDPTECRSR
jgi:hypothetical protein